MSVCECVRTRILHWKKIYMHGVCIRNASVGCYLFIHTSMYVQVHGCVYAYTVSTVVQPLSCNLRRNFGRYLVICLYVNFFCCLLITHLKKDMLWKWSTGFRFYKLHLKCALSLIFLHSGLKYFCSLIL